MKMRETSPDPDLPTQTSAYQRLMEYKSFMKETGIDLNANVAEAARINRDLFIKNVRSKGSWDYKHNVTLAMKYGQAFLADFGNWHFGVVAHAHGFNLETSLYGAGVYQVFKQGGGNPADLAVANAWMFNSYGGALIPDSITRAVIRAGFSWGDNPGDSISIMNGWDYYNENY
ncbi:hypothetical protein FE236_13050 [Mariprofundus erugo]|nr:hypothetical protein FE236_13050 [Mariprofundus erugo]